MAATHKRGRGQRGYLPGTQCILCVLGAWRDRHATIALRSPQPVIGSSYIVPLDHPGKVTYADVLWSTDEFHTLAGQVRRRHENYQRLFDKIEAKLEGAASKPS